MSGRPIQFRQKDEFGNFHFWGFDICPTTGDDKPDSGFSLPINGSSEQFTGLYDKEGNKIWEGDIVSCPALKKGCKTLIEVWWSPTEAMFTVEYPNTDYGAPIDKEGMLLCRVIGNIHQNPEMLNKNE